MATVTRPPVSSFACVRVWFWGFGHNHNCISALLVCDLGDG